MLGREAEMLCRLAIGKLIRCRIFSLSLSPSLCQTHIHTPHALTMSSLSFCSPSLLSYILQQHFKYSNIIIMSVGYYEAQYLVFNEYYKY